MSWYVPRCFRIEFKRLKSGGIKPFTNDFPHADVHELLSPDLLHQLIKGTFKDHFVDWVNQYLKLTHGKTKCDELLDEIDRRFVSPLDSPHKY